MALIPATSHMRLEDAPEGPFKVILYFKDLARGHSLIHGRSEISEADTEFIGQVALSSLPGHLRPIVRELAKTGAADSPTCAKRCQVSRTTIRKYFRELVLLEIATIAKGTPQEDVPVVVAGW